MILEHEPNMGKKGSKRQQMRNQQRKMLTEAFQTITLWVMPSPLDGADKQHVETLDETRPEFQDQVKKMRAEMAKQLQEPTRFVEAVAGADEQEASSYKDLTFKLSEQMMARAVKSMNSKDNLAPASMFEQISKAEGVQALSQLQSAVKEKWEQFKKETGVKDEAELEDIKAQMLQRKANILSKLDLGELPEDIQERMDAIIEDKFDHIKVTNNNRRFEGDVQKLKMDNHEQKEINHAQNMEIQGLYVRNDRLHDEMKVMRKRLKEDVGNVKANIFESKQNSKANIEKNSKRAQVWIKSGGNFDALPVEQLCVGRDDDIRQTHTALQTKLLVQIVGDPGYGKTTLAIHSVRTLNDAKSFGDFWFINLVRTIMLASSPVHTILPAARSKKR
jgi:hypothetical protein